MHQPGSRTTAAGGPARRVAGAATVAAGLLSVFSAVTPDEGPRGLGRNIHLSITVLYFVWAAWELLLLIRGRRRPLAFLQFAEMWKAHVRTGKR